MRMHRVVQFLMLASLLFVQSAEAFFDPPYVTPTQAVTGQLVSVNVRGGGCDGIVETPGYPQISRSGNAIRILFYGIHVTDSEACIYPIGTLTQPIGSFESGAYTLKVDFTYYDYPFGPTTITLGTVPFTVSGVPATAVPTPVNHPLALGLLALLLVGVAAALLRRRRSAFLILLLACVPLGARAQDVPTIEVLVTGASGAPTPAQIVAYYNTKPRSGPPPLQGLAGTNPKGANYLLPVRASGDFLAWLQAHPNSARKKLEDYVLVTFAAGTDLAPILAALQADPYVAAAYEPLPLKMSSVELVEFGIAPGEGPSGMGQYGRDDLNIDAAWQWAGGNALVAVVDTGLYEAHPALRQFAVSTYVGGNFIKAASLDISRTGLAAPNDDNASVDEARAVPISDVGCNASPPSPMPPVNAEHGTHVAGLIAANGTSGQGVQGTCEHCGIAMWKTHYAQCRPSTGEVRLIPNLAATDRGITQAIDTGAQVVNLSFGGQSAYTYLCQSHAYLAACLSLAYAQARDATLVASSGNDRRKLNFPAEDKRVIAAGGFDANLGLWDESPGSTTNCPVIPNTDPGIECGSNDTAPGTAPRQESMGSARAVLSTT